MKIAIITDAWKPQVNGVVTTYEKITELLQNEGHEVRIFHPGMFKTIPCPSYPEILLSLFPYQKLKKMIDAYRPEVVHIATEGTLGVGARRLCMQNGIKFTTAYHTKFPEYLRLRLPVPLKFSYAYLRWFHSKAEKTLVPSLSQKNLLESHGFSNLSIWGRGVDTNVFKPVAKRKEVSSVLKMVYVGRVAVEKNLETFLSVKIPGEKIVVGDGPDRSSLEKKFPESQFVGYKKGNDLVKILDEADVFVFPSLTDTFGIVMLEAMACGVPVAAFPVGGPRDVIIQGLTGYMHEDLGVAIQKALTLDRNKIRDCALTYTWSSVAETFLSCLVHNKVPLRKSYSVFKKAEISTRTL